MHFAEVSRSDGFKKLESSLAKNELVMNVLSEGLGLESNLSPASLLRGTMKVIDTRKTQAESQAKLTNSSEKPKTSD